MPRFWVESWDADYGSSVDFGEPEGEGGRDVDISIEREPEQWAPITPRANPARLALFVDGVQRIDARLWSTEEGGEPRQGLCASYAAGIVTCNDTAVIEKRAIERCAVGPGIEGDIDCGLGVVFRGHAYKDDSWEALGSWLNQRRDELEVKVAHAAGNAELVVVDGHIKGRETIDNVVGYIKSHNQRYLEPPQSDVVSRLGPGQRTPVFLISLWSRFSWYVKLPGGQGHPWAGVVRCEASPSLKTSEVIEFADLVTATLPRYASRPHKDSRAPQNLYPVAGLERDLRHRLGDRALVLRALQRASNLS